MIDLQYISQYLSTSLLFANIQLIFNIQRKKFQKTAKIKCCPISPRVICRVIPRFLRVELQPFRLNPKIFVYLQRYFGCLTQPEKLVMVLQHFVLY